jgi:hypothetical protein
VSLLFPRFLGSLCAVGMVSYSGDILLHGDSTDNVPGLKAAVKSSVED